MRRFAGVEKIQIALDGFPQLVLRIATTPTVLPAPAVIPVRVAHAAQVVKRRLQFPCPLRTFGSGRRRHLGKVTKTTFGQREQHIFVGSGQGPEPHGPLM